MPSVASLYPPSTAAIYVVLKNIEHADGVSTGTLLPPNSRMPLMELSPQQRISAHDDLMVTALQHCADLLAIRDFASCRVQAILAGKIDPCHQWPFQALAVADVLAAGKRLRNDRPDWYAILLAEKDAQLDVARSNFTKLIHLLDPRTNKFAFSHSAIESVMKAWRILSDPASKEKYDAEVATPETFYTVCPYCHFIFEYEFVYKDLCLRCQICQMAFHAAEINSPLPKFFKFVGADGCLKEGYYCQLACAPLHYKMNQGLTNAFNREVEGIARDNKSNSGDVEATVEVPEEEERPKKRTKTTAKNNEKNNMKPWSYAEKIFDRSGGFYFYKDPWWKILQSSTAQPYRSFFGRKEIL
ncbi:hypothetical protein SAY86_010296 [Trapa natans]|uniref:J domain-containing protein n=1 Tax=Trapa natans TaxID=22666 RepID=A0AAN7KYB9_TRANT|nr:hypothetical protein SAY86_010296 [Trapa natans]